MAPQAVEFAHLAQHIVGHAQLVPAIHVHRFDAHHLLERVLGFLMATVLHMNDAAAVPGAIVIRIALQRLREMPQGFLVQALLVTHPADVEMRQRQIRINAQSTLELGARACAIAL